VWESGIALGNRLAELGIRQIKGRLIISGVFTMNFERDRATAGELLRQSLDSDLWGYEAADQYQTLPPGTPEPHVQVLGGVAVQSVVDPAQIQLLIQQSSLPLKELLKQMNMYSNNIMAQLLVDLLGGAPALTQTVETVAQVPPIEVQLINGSGLGRENQLSPRAVCLVLEAISQTLKPAGLSLPDVMAVSNQDAGTLEVRHLPLGVVAKTGTLSDVSTLAGLIPKLDRPAQSPDAPDTLCFAILNQDTNIDLLYDQQDVLVTNLKKQLGTTPP
jgi:D-alanyl-D-alanine carboxypeptidase/D-alanyl-D-alanine-endopeptidase (penicillin-binding protein 4)